MEEKKLTYQDIPTGYPLCFNEKCTKKTCCMHYQAKMLLPERPLHGPAIYPTAWQDGECKCFCEKRLIQKAWGFSQLYRNIPSYMRAEARRSVSSLFGSGNGQYYRAHHGEIMISPKRQEEIMEVLAKYGSTEGIKFDHYVSVWDFD